MIDYISNSKCVIAKSVVALQCEADFTVAQSLISLSLKTNWYPVSGFTVHKVPEYSQQNYL